MRQRHHRDRFGSNCEQQRVGGGLQTSSKLHDLHSVPPRPDVLCSSLRRILSCMLGACLVWVRVMGASGSGACARDRLRLAVGSYIKRTLKQTRIYYKNVEAQPDLLSSQKEKKVN